MKNSLLQKSLSAIVLLIATIIFGLFSFWAPASSFLTSTVVFVDEGDNFLLSEKGPLTVITSYEKPNNHVFFTLIQSFLPDSFIYFNPLLLRINNLIFIVLTLIILAYILNKYAKFPFFLSVCLALGLLTISPVQLEWLLYARGYILGLLLVIGGCLSLVREKNMLLSALLFALSFWTVPTYGYILPGILAARFCRYLQEEKLIENTARTIQLGLLTAGITLIFYSPIIKDVIRASHLSWLQGMVYTNIVSFLQAWGEGFGQTASSKIFAPVLILLMFYCSSQILLKKSADFYWAALMAGASISYFIVVIFLDLLDITNPPFARNGMFTYTFVWGAIFMSSALLHRHLRNFLVVVFFGYTLLNLQVYFFSPLIQITSEGKPYTVFDHIRDIQPENIKAVIAGPQLYPVISMLTLEYNEQAENDPIKFRKIGWDSKRKADRIFTGECDVRGNLTEKEPQRDWKNKALILTKIKQIILICY